MSPSREVVSLFSGALGLDLGLHRAGLTTRVCQEMDQNAVATIRANGHDVISGNINDALNSEEVLTQMRGNSGDTFAVVGGPPCQSFSSMGKRKGMDDERGHLVYSFVKAVSLIMPRYFVMENVKGLAKAKMVSGELVIESLQSEFSKLGYSVSWDVLNAADYGAPQSRQRLIMLGSRDGGPVSMPQPTHSKTAQDGLPAWSTLRNAISDLDPNEPDEYVKFSKKQARIMSYIPEGSCWHAIRELSESAATSQEREFYESLGREAMGVVWDKQRRSSTSYWRRLAWDRPSPTLTTLPCSRGSMFGHPSQQRILSVGEYRRLQGFPDEWQMTGNTASKYRQIGNAVPVYLGAAIGRALLGND